MQNIFNISPAVLIIMKKTMADIFKRTVYGILILIGFGIFSAIIFGIYLLGKDFFIYYPVVFCAFSWSMMILLTLSIFFIRMCQDHCKPMDSEFNYFHNATVLLTILLAVFYGLDLFILWGNTSDLSDDSKYFTLFILPLLGFAVLFLAITTISNDNEDVRKIAKSPKPTENSAGQ